jgi:hypothetical protein
MQHCYVKDDERTAAPAQRQTFLADRDRDEKTHTHTHTYTQSKNPLKLLQVNLKITGAVAARSKA